MIIVCKVLDNSGLSSFQGKDLGHERGRDVRGTIFRPAKEYSRLSCLRAGDDDTIFDDCQMPVLRFHIDTGMIRLDLIVGNPTPSHPGEGVVVACAGLAGLTCMTLCMNSPRHEKSLPYLQSLQLGFPSSMPFSLSPANLLDCRISPAACRLKHTHIAVDTSDGKA